MGAQLFVYQLALVVLVGLFVLLPVPGSTPGLPTPPVPAKPKRPRAKAPKTFEGLTTKPPCALCERDPVPPQPPAPGPPAPVPLPTRRPPSVDTSRHFGPHTACDYRGGLGLGNLRAQGPPNGGPWRQCHCTSCQGYCPEHQGTRFQGKQAAVELIGRVLACLAAGLGLRATARVFAGAPHTGLQWWGEAAAQLRAFAADFLGHIHLEPRQLAEWYTVVRDRQAGAISAEEAIQRLERSPSWGWTAMDPQSKRLVVVDVGSRTLAMAQRVVQQVSAVLAPGCVPRCLTEGLKAYATALLTHFGQWRQPARRQEKGPSPKPRWLPLPALLYAPVVQSYRRRRRGGGPPRVVFGPQRAIAQILAKCGWTINTAFVERLNLDIRQRVAAIGRRVKTLCQGEDGLQYQLGLFQV
jgi:IS1 family transposase